VLAFEGDWKPPLGNGLKKALLEGDVATRLDIGCVAAHGMFYRDEDDFALVVGKKPATAFLLELIARLQELATVPMIDIRAYARWLDGSLEVDKTTSSKPGVDRRTACTDR
jgi:hypothetical protein